MGYRKRQVRYGYPAEFVCLAVLLAFSHSIVEIARLLNIPKSSLYRWIAQNKKFPFVQRSDTNDEGRQRVFSLAEASSSYGFDVQEKLHYWYGTKESAITESKTSPSCSLASRQCKQFGTQLKSADHRAQGGVGMLANHSPMASARLRPDTIARLSSVKGAIDARYFTALSCSELANAVNMSRFNLIKAFGAVYGVSPYRYLQSVRVRNAKRMLLSVNRPVDDIATAVGFECASSLVRAFKSIEGVSLSTYCRGVRFAA
jgi:AraC-like DNA-binding protein/predicted transcriptional regulator